MTGRYDEDLNVVERAWEKMPSAKSVWDGTKGAFNSVAKTAPEYTQWMSMAVVGLASYGFLNQFRKAKGLDDAGFLKSKGSLLAISIVGALAGYAALRGVHSHSNDLRREEAEQFAAQRAQKTGLSGNFDGRAQDAGGGGWEPAAPRTDDGWEPASPRSDGWEPADPRSEATVASFRPSGQDPFRS